MFYNLNQNLKIIKCSGFKRTLKKSFFNHLKLKKNKIIFSAKCAFKNFIYYDFGFFRLFLVIF